MRMGREPAGDISASWRGDAAPRARASPAGRWRWRGPALRYCVAVVATGAAAGLRLSLSRFLGPPYLLLYPTVMAVAVLGGLGPGLLATALSAVLAAVWILPAERQSSLLTTRDAVSLAAFVAMGLFMTAVAALYRRARHRIAEQEKDRALREAEERARRREEQALRRYEVLSAHTRDIILFVRGDDGRILEANAAALAAYGYGREELLALTVRDLRAPGAEELLGAQLADADARGIRFEAVHRRKDGSTFVVEIDSQATTLDGVRVLVSVARDVSDRRRAERALRDQEERLSLFIEYAPAAIAVLDRELRYLAVSRRWREDYGLGDQALTGRSHYEVFPDVPERWREIHRRCLNGAVERCEADPFPRADGRLDWVRWEIRPWREAGGRVGGLLLFSEVITESKRAEEALRRSEAQLQGVVEGIAEGLVVANLQGEMIHWNRAALALHGFATVGEAPRSVVAFQALFELGTVEGEELPGAQRPLTRILRGERVRDLELRLRRRADGWTRVYSYGGELVRDADGRPFLAVQTITDVTEHRELEEQYRQAQKLESLGRLAGGIAHDFNNLLTVILSNAEALRSDLREGLPGRPDDADEILVAGERARDLTRQLLTFARKQAIAPVPLDLGAAVRGSERLLQRMLGEDVELVVKDQPGLWPTLCDAGQLEQVLLNLAVNARDAMPEGGVLTIEAENVVGSGAEADHPSARPPGDWVCLRISDTGTGISPEAKLHLFEPFFTTKPPGKGTGLGLATVHGIVTQHGGQVSVWSELGKGTTFEAYLPRSGVDARPAPARAEVAPLRGSEAILVVEDDSQVRGVTTRALQGAGYQVHVAGDGAAALGLAERLAGHLDLVVTDVVMPGLSGRAVADALRRRQPGLRVLFVSGHPQDAIAQHGVLDAGVQFLPKPFTPTSLLARVRAILDARPD